jgi:DNA-binding FrmR family transcriptional regulator
LKTPQPDLPGKSKVGGFGMPSKRLPVVNSAIYLTPELEEDLGNRLSRIEGHVRGVRNMLTEHRDCDHILTQVAGVQAAIRQVAILLLDGHLDTCVAEAIRSGEGGGAVEQFKESLSRVLR